MKECKISSPVSGKVLPITSVPDGVFSEKILGDGVAICPQTAGFTVRLTEWWIM